MRLSLFLMAAGAIQAADGPKVEVPKAPVLSSEQRAKFWRAQAEQIAATARVQQTTEALKAVQEDLQKACGTAALVLDQAGEPACVASEKKPASVAPVK